MKRSTEFEGDNVKLSQLTKKTHLSVVTDSSDVRRKNDKIKSLFNIPSEVKLSIIKSPETECTSNYGNVEDYDTFVTQEIEKNGVHCKHCQCRKGNRYQASWKAHSMKEIRDRADEYLGRPSENQKNL